MKLVGPGVERLAEEIQEAFPKKSIEIMSSDNANTPTKIKKIINDFSQKKIDILVATQIMSKGYHFPDLSLVCVIDADAGLIGGDLRATEKTYNLLEQVGGRAGHSKYPGKVLIQTYFPNQPLIQALKNRNRKQFIEQTLMQRKQFNSPPFSFLTAIIVSGHSKNAAESYAKAFVSYIKVSKRIIYLGPVEAPLFLLRGRYRFRVLLKGSSRRELNNITRNIIKTCPIPGNLRVIIDVDPYSFF